MAETLPSDQHEVSLEERKNFINFVKARSHETEDGAQGKRHFEGESSVDVDETGESLPFPYKVKYELFTDESDPDGHAIIKDLYSHESPTEDASIKICAELDGTETDIYGVEVTDTGKCWYFANGLEDKEIHTDTPLIKIQRWVETRERQGLIAPPQLTA